MAAPLQINGNFKGKDVLSLSQFDQISLKKLFSVVPKMADIAKNSEPSSLLAGNIVTLLFYEPSSRTFGSFSSAVKQLGGQTLEFTNPLQTSSAVKGETLEDTMRIFQHYGTAIVIRHFEKGAAQIAADAASIPVINAGDGIGEHPTQALLDLYTIYEQHKKLDGLTGLITGDILHGRTVHSLLLGLSLFKKNTVYLLSPQQLRLTRADFALYQQRGLTLIEIEKENEIPKNADFWYWTRVQKERFTSLDEYEKVKHSFIATQNLLDSYAGKHTILMHPLPRVGEIVLAVDNDPRAVYFTKEVPNGKYVRMALLALVLGKLS